MTQHTPRKGVELFREDDAYVVSVDVAAYDREDVTCGFEDGVVAIEAGSSTEGPEPFRRQIGLPVDVREDGIEASVREGVLEVTIPVGE